MESALSEVAAESGSIRWGIVGAGMMGIEHIQNLRITPGAQVVALADPHAPSIARAQAAAGGEVATFDTAEALVHASSGAAAAAR